MKTRDAILSDFFDGELYALNCLLTILRVKPTITLSEALSLSVEMDRLIGISNEVAGCWKDALRMLTWNKFAELREIPRDTEIVATEKAKTAPISPLLAPVLEQVLADRQLVRISYSDAYMREHKCKPVIMEEPVTKGHFKRLQAGRSRDEKKKGVKWEIVEESK